MKTRLSTIILLTLALSFSTCSEKGTEPQEGALQGTVTMEGQQDHSGISIQIRELDRWATTSTSGSYSFSAIPPGTYTLLFTDGETARHIYDFVVLQDISITAGRSTTASAVELPLFQRVEDDLAGQVNWTATDGPYLVTRSLTVLPGAQLLVEPGTIVKFEDYYRLTVKGRLIAKGTATDSITFSSMLVAGGPGDWDRISIEGPKETPSDTLSFCCIQNANVGVASSQSSPAILDNTIMHCSGYGLVMTVAAPEIHGNLLRDNYGGISFENGSAGIIRANLIEENATAGIACAGSSPEICDNIIAGNQRGIQAQSESDPLVWHNKFLSNEDAIYLFYYCDPWIEANEITGQQRFGFQLVGYHRPHIHFNNIGQSGNYSLYLKDQPYDIEAQNNWWDTSEANEISALVWDRQDDSRLGNAFIDPILTTPVDSAGPRALPETWRPRHRPQ